MSAIFLDENPSPYGFDALLIFSYSSLLVSNKLKFSYITSSSVPTNLSVPAVTPSDLSVVSP